MMNYTRYCLSFLLLLTIVSGVAAQVKGAGANLKVQVNRMADALMKGDYKTFTVYTHPAIISAAGGASRMTSLLTKAIDDMKAGGMSFSRITFDEPGQLVKSGQEWQTTIAQHTELKLPSGRAVSTSTLIAISADDGKDWTFVDTSNKDIAVVRKLLPHLSPDIVIPPQQPPVRYAN
jgi:hypothetical protein